MLKLPCRCAGNLSILFPSSRRKQEVHWKHSTRCYAHEGLTLDVIKP